jgi:hypothetical protein
MERYLDNYVPCAKRQCVDEEDILPNVEVDAIVYAYCQNVSGCSRTDDVPLYDSSIHGAPIYVGQTINDITTRDKQHRSYTATPFDKHYTNRAQYTLVILCRRTFAPATSLSAFRDDTLRPAAEWMDLKEKHFISHFDTYHNGWNSTKGGQGRAWLVAIREAQAKATAKRFETDYMPAFREYHRENEDINVPFSHPVLGKLLNSIRTGNTAIPPLYEEELTGMGLDLRNQKIVQRDEMWENKYMPAFRDYYENNKDINVPQSHPVLGKLVRSIRSCHTAIPPQHEEELVRMGLDLRNQNNVQRDERFENEYMPKFRDHHKEHGHVNAFRSYPVLGSLVSSIRTGYTAIPPQHEDELIQMGLDLRNQRIVQRDELWENEYMPAFRDHHTEHGHVNAMRFRPVLGRLVSHIRRGNTAIPPQHEDELVRMGLDLRNQHIVQRDEMWETKYMPELRDHYKEHGHVNASRSSPPVLGNLVARIRNGYTAIPSQHKDEFKEWGFFWCTRNLARHVSRMLGRTVVSLDNDAEAMDAVTKAAAHHATLLALRSTLTKEERKVSGLTRIPFGNTTIGDGVARFHADVASMEGEERDMVEETCI